MAGRNRAAAVAAASAIVVSAFATAPSNSHHTVNSRVRARTVVSSQSSSTPAYVPHFLSNVLPLGNSHIAHCEAAPVHSKKEEFVVVSADHVAVYLDLKSIMYLKERYPAQYAEVLATRAVFIPPTYVNQDEYRDIHGKEVTLNVTAYVTDDRAEGVLVELPEELRPYSAIGRPYIGLSAENKGEQAAEDLNVMISKIPREGADANVLATSNYRSLTNGEAFTASNIEEDRATKLNRLSREEVFTLTGTVCLGTHWEPEPRSCENKYCGFCAFMRAGPCDRSFREWERAADDLENESIDEEISSAAFDKIDAELNACMTKKSYYKDFLKHIKGDK